MKAIVVVICYNHERYIAECLESILSQEINFPCDIVVADDCSSDASVLIIRRYQALYPNRITLITREKNLGHARHYIETHQSVSGDIIFEFDGDDIMLPGKLQKQYDLFQSDETINLVFHRARYFSDDATYFSETGRPLDLADDVMSFDYKDLALWGTIAVHGSYAYRQSSRKLKDPKREFMEWLYAMDSLIPSGKGIFLNDVLMKYRCNPAGHGSYLSTKKGRTKAYAIYLNDVMAVFNEHSAIRRELYANYLITSLAMLKARCGLSMVSFRFLIKNIMYFSYVKVTRAMFMRLSVAPEQRVR